MPRIKKKLSAIFIAIIIIPGFFIGILGFYLVSQQKNVRLLNIKKEFNRRLIQLRTDIEEKIQLEIDKVFQQFKTNTLGNYSPVNLSKHLKKFIFTNPIVRYPFFITSNHRFLFPWSQKNFLPNIKSPTSDFTGLNKRAQLYYSRAFQLENEKKNLSKP